MNRKTTHAPRWTKGTLLAAFFALALSPATLGAQDLPLRHLSDLGPHAVERVISFFSVGGSSTRLNDYRPPSYMPRGRTWRDFIARNVEPEYAWGVRRWALHNPFGNTTYGPMIFDQFVKAPQRGYNYLVDDFVEAWSEFMRKHDDVELIVYLGKMRDVPTFDQNLPQRPDIYLERALESVRPVLRLREFGKVGIGFDASSGVTANHPVYHFMRLIQSMGVAVYCEAWPHRDNMHLAEVGVTAAERFYQRHVAPEIPLHNRPAAGADDEEALEEHSRIPPDRFKGEIAIMVTGNLASMPGMYRNPKLFYDLAIDIVERRGYAMMGPIRLLMPRDE